jgi:hypothetical protein
VSPLARILLAPWEPATAAAVAFAHGWVLWFVLGRDFTRTLLMTAASRAVVGGGAWWLAASGALGRQDPAWRPETAHWLAAAATAWWFCWCLDAAVIRRMMRRFQPGWRWKAYDPAVLGAAQAAYLAGGWLLLG